jgi:hypothetical protein
MKNANILRRHDVLWHVGFYALRVVAYVLMVALLYYGAKIVRGAYMFAPPEAGSFMLVFGMVGLAAMVLIDVPKYLDKQPG